MLFPLTADESYYWLWSKHLDLSYVDHPPMIAYLNFLITFGKENLFTLRLGAVLIALAVSILIYQIAKEIFNEKIAFWSAVLFQIVPHFLAIWLTMFVELPLGLFWAVSLLILVRVFKTKDQRLKTKDSLAWYLLGITVGLGYLSKYTMFLFWPCLALFFLLSKEDRFWLKRKEPYLALALSFVFFLPILYWNSQHQWASFVFHGAKLSSDSFGINFLSFLADQMAHFTPFVFFALFSVFKFSLKKRETKLLFCFSAPILILFLLLSLKMKVWAHWPAVGYLAALPLIVAYFTQKEKALSRFFAAVSIFSFLVLAVLLLVSPGVILRQSDYRENYRIKEKIDPELKIFAKTNTAASLLEFYLQRPVYLATGFLKTAPIWGEKQYEIWGIPALKKNESVIYFGEDSAAFHTKANEYFKEVAEMPKVTLFLIEDYLTNNFKFFRLERFQADNLRP